MTPDAKHDTGLSIISNNYSSHAIDRSDELLSVSQTALSILLQKQQFQDPQTNDNDNDQPPPAITIQPQDLTLHEKNEHNNNSHDNTANDILSEAVLTLNHLDETLKKLSKLVKRRGHTNDPTNEINNAMNDFQSFVKDVMEIIDVTLPQAAALPLPVSLQTVPYNGNQYKSALSSGQRRKHYEMASKILKINVEERMETFKHVMKVRGDVIKDLTMRRKRLLQKNNDENDKNFNSAKNSNDSYQPARHSYNNNMGGGRPTHSGLGVRNAALKPQMNAMSPTKVKSQLNSPLFTMSSAPISNPYATKSNNSNHSNTSIGGNPSNSTHKKPLSGGEMKNNGSSNYSYYKPNIPGGYGYNTNAAGYGGYANSTGMRHRNNTTSTNSLSTSNAAYNPYQNDDEIKVHDESNSNNNIQSQIQKRRAARQTQTRLESARMAEKTLAELTSMFGKMSNLIQSQGETLEKIEDDVEIAVGYVDDGYKEVEKLYDFTKGNRGLIVKCFGILIFMVVLMKYYG